MPVTVSPDMVRQLWWSTVTSNVVEGIAGTAEAPKISEPTCAAVTVTVYVPSVLPVIELDSTPCPVGDVIVNADGVDDTQVTDGMYELLVD